MRIIVIKGTEITNIAYPFPMNNPEVGVQPNGSYVLYLTDLDGLEDWQFMEQRYWDGNSLQIRDPKPSRFCYWVNNSWQVNSDEYLVHIRQLREAELFRSDWTQLPDAPLTQEQVQEAQTYRQALRDMTDPIIANPSAYITEEDAPWPVKPSFLNAT